MTSELIIDAQPKEVTIALLEDQKLVEFQKEGQDSKYSVGNIYAGKVKKIMPALNACFVDVGGSSHRWQRLLVSLRWRKLEAFKTCLNWDKR